MNGPFFTVDEVVMVEVLADPSKLDRHVILTSIDPTDSTRQKIVPGSPVTFLVGKANDRGEQWAVLSNNQLLGLPLKNLKTLDRKEVIEVTDSNGKRFFT